MKTTYLLLATFFTVALGWSQNKQPQTKATPKSEWRVNKTYDNDGNLIAYDSVYVKSYNGLKNLNFNNLDSLFQSRMAESQGFTMPDFDFSDLDSLSFNAEKFLKNFKFPDFSEFQMSPDSLKYNSEFFQNLFPKDFDMKKELERMKQDFEKLQQKINDEPKTKKTSTFKERTI